MTAIAHHHTPDEGRDVVCDVVCMADVVAKQVGAGYVAQAQELDVPPDTLGRLGLSSKDVEKICEQVKDCLEGVLAQYEAA